uniref:Deacetylase sirtuin-type domain-containing protein n=2 Tax=Clytia hemisphaerica TaxID=252671 RepID=A0A7M5XKV3_9CNID
QCQLNIFTGEHYKKIKNETKTVQQMRLKILWGLKWKQPSFFGCCHYYKRSIHHKIARDDKFVPKCHQPSEDTIRTLSDFINSSRRLFVLTGAGLSTESGIRDYRSEGVGQYSITTDRPTQHIDFVKSPNKRQRYWARNFAGWPVFRNFQPNINHMVIAEMEKYGNIHWLVTQNVDGLHQKAGSSKITELHGSTARVGCLSCDFEISRDNLQRILLRHNVWDEANIGRQSPDADVVVPNHAVQNFKMVDCPSCGGVLKPKVVFFGDNVAASVKDFIFQKLDESDKMLVVGSSLQVYSSFRFILGAKERNIPIAILNIGETRGDKHCNLKVNAKAGDVLPRLLLPWK